MAISVTSTVLDEGRKLILRAASGFSSFVPFKYSIGSQANAAIVGSTAEPFGEVVFEGAAYLMESKIINEEQVRYTLLVPESAGPFYIGNIIMYAVGPDSNPVPFVALNFPIPMMKRRSAIDEEDNRPFPGSRMIISVTMRHTVLDSGDVENVVVEVSTPEYATLPTMGSNYEIADPNTNPWRQFVVQHMEQSATPAFVGHMDTDEYWTMPLFKNLRHPYYHVISGGMTGDDYLESLAPWIGGVPLKVPNTRFTHTLGARPLSAIGTGLNRIGGLPLSQQ